NSRLTGVVETSRIATITGVREAKELVIDQQLAGDQLLAALTVPRDDAAHDLRTGPRAADRDRHVVANPQPLPARLVRDVDLHAADPEENALLPRPREM